MSQILKKHEIIGVSEEETDTEEGDYEDEEAGFFLFF